MKKTHLLTLIFSLASMQAAGEVVARDPSSGGARPDFKAAKAACESSQYNTAGITLPEWTRGQRPTITDAQRSLIQACEQAGILPPHRHHHGPPPGEMAGGQPPGPPPSDE